MVISTQIESIDVLIIGAGVSGISAAYYLKSRCPDKSWKIIEARDAIGGTWDLFKYPGIRSDSDLYTFGYSFKPWTREKAFATGPEIKDYLEETADEFGIRSKIDFKQKALSANFDETEAKWAVEIEIEGGPRRTVKCSMLYVCSGYYDYDQGYSPNWDTVSKFKGTFIHPQDWPEDFDYTGKNIVVIGSGATAITLIPALADKAAHVTMLQRSPSYVSEMPAKDWLAAPSRKYLGQKLSHKIIRCKNILRTIFYYQLARRFPNFVSEGLKKAARQSIAPDFDVETHFSPDYKPWDQRVCVDKDGEFFSALSSEKASIVTDTIDEFTANGILLNSGKTLEADVIVSATGLVMKFLGGMDISVNGKPVSLPETYMYKGMSFSGLPNLAYSIGYTNASWTLKCELIARYVCRLINEMDRRGKKIIVPIAPDDIDPQKALDLESGYINRAESILPKQGKAAPWRVYQNYILDKIALGTVRLDDGAMKFTNPPSPSSSDL